MDACEKLRVGQMVIENVPVKDIAVKMGRTEATIYRTIADKEVKARIEHVRALIAQEAYEKSAQNVISVINDYDRPVQDKDDRSEIQRKDHGYKASVKVLESMGVLPSQSPSIFVQQIYNTQVNNYVSPLVKQALDHALGTISSPDQIPEEIVEDK